MEVHLGTTAVRFTEWVAAGKPNPALVQHLPYTSIYGSTRSRSELGLVEPSGKVTRIECKWQNVSGSVDEKFPYVLENALAVPESRILIVVGGNGFKPQAIEWLAHEGPIRGQMAGKTILVLRGLDALNSWVQREVSAGAFSAHPLAFESGDAVQANT